MKSKIQIYFIGCIFWLSDVSKSLDNVDFPKVHELDSFWPKLPV